MVPALVLGISCAAIYGLFLFIRGLTRLYKLNERKMLICSLGMFLLGCLIVVACLLVKVEAMNIWIAFPALLVVFGLVSAGYFLEAYLKAERRRRTDGLSRVIPARPRHWLRNNLVLLALGLVLWVIGAFIGYGGNGTVETCLLCLCVFLLAKSLASLWKYRGF